MSSFLIRSQSFDNVTEQPVALAQQPSVLKLVQSYAVIDLFELALPRSTMDFLNISMVASSVWGNATADNLGIDNQTVAIIVIAISGSSGAVFALLCMVLIVLRNRECVDHEFGQDAHTSRACFSNQNHN